MDNTGYLVNGDGKYSGRSMADWTDYPDVRQQMTSISAICEC